MAPLLAECSRRRGDTVLVMRGEDGLDEFTTTAPTRLWIASDGGVRETVLDAEGLGIVRTAADALRGGDVAVNGAAARRLFAGEPGAVADAVAVNAAMAIVAHAARRDRRRRRRRRAGRRRPRRDRPRPAGDRRRAGRRRRSTGWVALARSLKAATASARAPERPPAPRWRPNRRLALVP